MGYWTLICSSQKSSLCNFFKGILIVPHRVKVFKTTYSLFFYILDPGKISLCPSEFHKLLMTTIFSTGLRMSQ